MAKQKKTVAVRSKPGTAEPSGSCGCGSLGKAGVGDSADCKVGPGGGAAGIDPDLKDANLRQLRRIEGQVRGIAGMVETDRYCADIVTQVAAVRESLHAVARNLMRNHLKHCAAKALAREGPERDEIIDELLALVSKIAR